MDPVLMRWRLLATAVATGGGFLVRWIRQRTALHGVATALGWGPSILYAFGLVILLLSLRIRQPLRWALALGAVTGALAYEFAQRGLTGRTFDASDVLATLAGGALAFALDRFLPAGGHV